MITWMVGWDYAAIVHAHAYIICDVYIPPLMMAMVRLHRIFYSRRVLTQRVRVINSSSPYLRLS